MDTLQEVKDQYYINLDVERHMSLDEYIRTYYWPCYDDHLNFIGYDRKSVGEISC